jgi:hypothetical protein
MKKFSNLFLVVAIFSLLYSCKKGDVLKDTVVKIIDPVSGDYLCHDIYHHSFAIGFDSLNNKWIDSVKSYDSSYIIHFDFKKDSNNLIRFQSQVFSLTDSFTYDYAIYSNGGHKVQQLKFINDSVYYFLDYYSWVSDVSSYQLIRGKKIK